MPRFTPHYLLLMQQYRANWEESCWVRLFFNLPLKAKLIEKSARLSNRNISTEILLLVTWEVCVFYQTAQHPFWVRRQLPYWGNQRRRLERHCLHSERGQFSWRWRSRWRESSFCVDAAHLLIIKISSPWSLMLQRCPHSCRSSLESQVGSQWQ